MPADGTLDLTRRLKGYLVLPNISGERSAVLTAVFWGGYTFLSTGKL